MKLNRWDRAGIAVYVALAFVFACAIAPDIARSAGASFADMMERCLVLRLALIAACVTLAVFICSRAWSLVHGGGKSVAAADAPVELSSDEGGSVQVSQAALESLVRRAVGSVGGTEQYEVRVARDGDRLNVKLEASVRQGTPIPELAQAARESVRRTLESMAGVTVEDVALLVTEIVPETAAPKPPSAAGQS